MPRRVPSSVDRLSPEHRQLIADLRVGHGRTLDEIMAALLAAGAPAVSRSALGRHIQKLEQEWQARLAGEMAKISPAMQFANALAAAMVGRMEGQDNQAKLRATREIIQGQLFQMAVAAMQPGEDGPALGPKDFFVMSRALQTLAQAERTEEARIREAEKAAAEAARAAAVAAVEKVARTRAGLTADTVEAIRHAVLGDA
jgi:hypothetical protein